MARYAICLLLFKFLLPILISTCIIFRPSGLSAVYLLILFYLPFVPTPTEHTMKGHTGIFLKILLGLCILTFLGQATFQIVLFAMPPYAHFLMNDPNLENILRYAGFVRLNKTSTTTIIIWLSPEILMLAIAIVYFIVLRKLTSAPPDNPEEVSEHSLIKPPTPLNAKMSLVGLGKYCVLALLCTAGILRPSVLGGLYYLVFLITATWWACYKPLTKGFAIFLCCLAPIVIVHISMLFTYQFDWTQEQLESNSTYARYFGLTPLLLWDYDSSSDATTPTPNTTIAPPENDTLLNNQTLAGNTGFGTQDSRKYIINKQEEWVSFINPAFLYILYYVIILEVKELFNPELQKKQGPFSRLEGSFTGKLRRNMSQRLSKSAPLKRWQSAGRKVRDFIRGKKAKQPSPGEQTPLLRGISPKSSDKRGQESLTSGPTEDIPMDELGDGEDEYEPTVCENILYALESILQLIVRSSYIGTNIIMMAWSITYLSWITFILLIWANLIWLLPKHRKSMLASSPVLVVYALFLLISAYIYCMNLTEEELPSELPHVNLKELGFDKITNFPCVPLYVKSLFTVMFWITLRQYMQERLETKQKSALADMVAPLQVTVGTATGVSKEDEKTGSKIIKKFGKLVKDFLTKCWIWVVAITLFAVAITGQRMTGFRILYMFLFLVFIITFQISFKIWRKIMFGFWLTIIIYSMIILILVYTYQFSAFPGYWKTYLHVNYDIQLDIGLEKFEPKQLFIRLVTPTFFVIITVVQLHYFHNDFMALSDPNNAVTGPSVETAADLEESSMQGGAELDRSNLDQPSSSIHFDVYLLQDMSNERLQHVMKSTIIIFHKLKNLFYTFLELHMTKVILFFAMLLCVYDTCAIYFIIMIFIILALTFGRPVQLFVVYASSIMISIMLLARMVFQVQYITPKNWSVTCMVTQNSEHNQTVVNNAPWFGFQKESEAGRSLPSLVKWNIIYISVITLWSVVMVRQYNHRLQLGRPTTRAFFMFPTVTTEDADKSLKLFLKYMFNFAFYKFGVEISFSVVVIVIATRMDMYALLHAMWLLCFVFMTRKVLARIWVFYLIYNAISLPIQFIMVIGLPPTLCIEFPWDGTTYVWESLQDWAYLLDNFHPLDARKLLCDFFILLVVSRQWVVFRIENRYRGKNYAGGSNESVIHLIEQPNFKNPVSDYITYVRSYVDILKKVVLQSLLWVTLAVVFLAGTSRVSIYSIGYLICAFVFLWYGSDFYLRPIPRILRWWHWLIGYNVSVILIKTILQIVGCIYNEYLPSDTCWMVQLLGIGCIRKFHYSGKIPYSQGVCNIPTTQIGLSWDAVCFILLIFQRRLFKSYNFFHIVNDTKATAILASRGAELIEEMRQKTMKDQEEQEERILEKIRQKMDRIKANQKKIQGANYSEKTSHCVDSIYKDRPQYRVKPPKHYKEAIRSGDYYMFDELEDEDIDILPEQDEDDEDKLPRPDVSTLLVTTMKADMDTAIRNQSVRNLRRQYSMPSSRQKSAGSQISGAYSAPPTVGPRSTRLRRLSEEDEPQPGSSRDDDYYTEPQTRGRKILKIVLFIWAFIESAMVSLTNFLNRYSKDYRSVLKTLAIEKRSLKENTDYTNGMRHGAGQVWAPAASYHHLVKQQSQMSSVQNSDTDDKLPLSEDSDTKVLATSLTYSTEQDRRKASVLTVPEIRILAASLERGLDSPCSSRKSSPPFRSTDTEEMSSYDQPTIFRLLLAIWYIVMSRSEILCYFVVFLNHNNNATFLSLPLPMLVFLWGSLTIPRPSKTFWITLIAYAEVRVLLKCIAQFDLMPGNKIRPKTEFTWSEQEHHTMNPAYLFGMYRHADYASWDLVLLLVLFFHRILLKSMGIWSSTTSTPAAMLSDGEYKLQEGQLVPANSESTSSRKGKSKSISSDADSLIVRTREIHAIDHVTLALKMAFQKYAEAFKIFNQQLLDPTSRVASDVYFLMFICDFFNFFVLVFGYSSFGTQQDGGVQAYLEDNRVPQLFVFMLLFQFMLIIIDRGIYLRKNILAKIIFQYVQIVLLHVWLFAVFPVITGTTSNMVLPPQIYYMVKCFYLLLSAYQIRCGYPTRILGNFLCKGYGYVNMLLFRVFMIIPFLFELRTCMDWMWTETSMTIFDWIKMEDIYQHIFLLKCSRHAESEYPQPRGEKKKPVTKYLMGGLLLLLIIAILWFPLIFFSLSSTVGKPNIPYELNLNVRISTHEPIYKMTAQSNSITAFNDDQLNKMLTKYNNFKASETFLYNYEAADVAAVTLSTDSSNIWSISPPDRNKMIAEIKSDAVFKVSLEYVLKHKTSNPEDSGAISHKIDIDLQPYIDNKVNEERTKLLNMLEGNSSNEALFEYILPKFLKVTNRGTAEPISDLMLEEPDERAKSYRNISAILKSLNSSSGQIQEWWTVREERDDFNYEEFLHDFPFENCTDCIVIFTFNDKIFPPSLNWLTGGGIIGVYTTVVFICSRFIRSNMFDNQCAKIMFDDLPFVDRILQLCFDIYLVREASEFALEEDLFAKLVFLFRSPETLIKWTRPKEEEGDDDEEDDDSRQQRA